MANLHIPLTNSVPSLTRRRDGGDQRPQGHIGNVQKGADARDVDAVHGHAGAAGARPDGITSRPVDGMALAARLFGSLMGTRHDGRALRNCLPALHLYRPTFDRITDDLRLGPGFFCHFQTLANIGEGIVGVLLILQ